MSIFSIFGRTQDSTQYIFNILKPQLASLGLPEAVNGVEKRLFAPNTRAPKWDTRDVTKLEGLVLHQALGNQTLEEVHVYHSGKNSHLRPGGVYSISYTWGIRKNGQIVLCNPMSAKTWSHGDASKPGDENARYVSCLVTGNFTHKSHKTASAGQPTAEQILSAILLFKAHQKAFKWPNTALLGHCDLGKPACPGELLELVTQAVRGDV